jgi:hypothetical protein
MRAWTATSRAPWSEPASVGALHPGGEAFVPGVSEPEGGYGHQRYVHGQVGSKVHITSSLGSWWHGTDPESA